MCRKESCGAIAVPMEAHSTQRGQLPRMHGPGLWKYGQKEQRVTPPRSNEQRDLLIIAYCSRNCSNIRPHTFEIVDTSVTQCHIEFLSFLRLTLSQGKDQQGATYLGHQV